MVPAATPMSVSENSGASSREESGLHAVDTGRVLITGANGHLGRRLIQRLSAQPGASRPVRAVVRSERAAATLREGDLLSDTNIAILDYADEDALAGAAADCEVAVHLVGIIKESGRSRYRDSHEATCSTLSRVAARTGLRRILHLSIVGADPDSPNACLASRGRAEQILLAGPVPALVIRVPMVLGPDDYASRALRAQAQARVVPLLRGGAGREQPIDADDVVAALVKGIERPELESTILDLAGPECLSRRELLARTAALYGNHPTVIPIPLAGELAFAFLLEKLLSDPPLTRAMVGVLDHDDVIHTRTACEFLHLSLTPLSETLARYVGPEGDTA
jgi:NADH dehydrogenase